MGGKRGAKFYGGLAGLLLRHPVEMAVRQTRHPCCSSYECGAMVRKVRYSFSAPFDRTNDIAPIPSAAYCCLGLSRQMTCQMDVTRRCFPILPDRDRRRCL